jgi:hypothetical protein
MKFSPRSLPPPIQSRLSVGSEAGIPTDQHFLQDKLENPGGISTKPMAIISIDHSIVRFS